MNSSFSAIKVVVGWFSIFGHDVLSLFLRLRFEGYQVEAGLLKVIPKQKTPKNNIESENTELFIAQKEIFNSLIDKEIFLSSEQLELYYTNDFKICLTKVSLIKQVTSRNEIPKLLLPSHNLLGES